LNHPTVTTFLNHLWEIVVRISSNKELLLFYEGVGESYCKLYVYNTICENFALCVLKLHQSSFKLLSAWLQCHVNLDFPDYHCRSIWWII